MPAAKPTQAQITRVVKGAMDAGFAVGAVEVKLDGTIKVLPATKESPQRDPREPDPWD